MSDAFENLKAALRKAPGIGAKAAERIALNIAVENRELGALLRQSIDEALNSLSACPECGALSENGKLCRICADPSRRADAVCVVESVLDIFSIEKSGAWRGRYFVLGGKLSPLKRIGPEKLGIDRLKDLVVKNSVVEIILALSNDIEGEATCRYLQEAVFADMPQVKLSRIGFGLPSGSGLLFADSSTIKSALDSRKIY